MQKLELPLGMQTFKTLRNEGCYYVDKTALIYQLVAKSQPFFLSRPRRFGKSLLLDTIQCLFEGEESLFQGLAIHQKWDWSPKNIYPVVRLGFEGEYHHPEAIRRSVLLQLSHVEETYELKVSAIADSTAQERLQDVLFRLHKKIGQQVVVLVDEYDKPILDVIADRKLARANRAFLRGLYGVLKGCMKHIRFVFLTGITKFSKVSFFSGLNNVIDISLESQYAAICGFTDHELNTVFAPDLEGLDREKIRDWYNGYSWDMENKVYNPYSILKLFRSRKFQDWWFESGTPTYLYQLLLKKAHSAATLNRLENFWIRAAALSTFDIDKMQVEVLLFQSGYLTMVEEDVNKYDETEYRLQFPNFEVRKSFYQKLLEYLVEDEQAYNNARQQGEKLVELLGKGHFDAFQEALSILLHDIPNQWYHPGNIHHYEGVYAIALYAIFADLGLTIRAEAASSHGRSDIILLHAGQVFVLELKMAKDQRETEKMLDKAIQQIQDRKYGEEYKSRGEPIHLIALAFGIKERNIVGMKRERLM